MKKYLNCKKKILELFVRNSNLKIFFLNCKVLLEKIHVKLKLFFFLQTGDQPVYGFNSKFTGCMGPIQGSQTSIK